MTFPVCFHKNGHFEDVTMMCDPVRAHLHIDRECTGVRRETFR